MEIITNILRNFLNAQSQFSLSVVMALILLSIFALTLFIGWKVNNNNPEKVKESVTFIKEKHKEENIRQG